MVYDFYKKFLNERKEQDLFRTIPTSHNDIKINFSSNDYLNLSRHPQVIQKANTYCQTWGAGANSVRLLLKNRQEIYADLEKKIAAGKRTEAALLLPSAYQINATVIPSLVNDKILKSPPLILADKLVHESILHGILASKAKFMRYRHLDMNHLENLLKTHSSVYQAKFIISESIFSMDGDLVNMKDLTFLSRKYNAFLYIDESHATGVIGTDGYGISQDFSQDVDISISTLGKAVGAFGGFVACNQVLKDYLINTCSGFIYSSVLPPAVIGAIDAAWDLIPQMKVERQYIHTNAEYLRKKIKALGYQTGQSETQIIPLFLKDNQTALTYADAFNKEGISVSAIRPPTVPDKTARLRICTNAGHLQKDIVDFLDILQRLRENK